jgi:hypothetical protein
VNLHTAFGSLKSIGAYGRFSRCLLLATSVLAVSSMIAPASADVNQGAWYAQWQGSTYHCQFTAPTGSYSGYLKIDRVRPDNYDPYSCYWQGTCSFGSQFYPCEGYAKQGYYSYFKMTGDYDWFCLGDFSPNLRQMRGYYCDFQHGYVGSWYCSYDSGGGYNNGGYNSGGYSNGGSNSYP